jgi:hypothetical protein
VFSLLLVGVWVCWLLAAANAWATTNYTWTGKGETSDPNWSSPINWEGGSAPSGSVGMLDFPEVQCLGTRTPEQLCPSVNDVTGLKVNAISLALAENYKFSGDAITLGAGGVTASTVSQTDNPYSYFNFPVALSAPQVWSLNGGPGESPSFLVLDGDLSGEAAGLGIHFDSPTYLYFEDNAEVGPVDVTGTGSLVLGEAQLTSKSAVGSLDATDGQAVTLHEHAGLFAFDGKVGPLTAAEHNQIELGVAQYPGILAVDGPLTLGSTSALTFITKEGETIGTGYSQLSASGAVKLAGASLHLDDEFCALTPGTVETLITTTGSLEGTFRNTPNGATIPIECLYGGNPSTVMINYSAHDVTATVETAGGGERDTPPEFGRCLKVPAEKEGTKTVYHGGFTTAACLVASSTKTGKYEWHAHAEKYHFTLTGGAITLKTVAGKRVVCATASGSGEYQASDDRVAISSKFFGCGSNGTKCTTPGLAEGELEPHYLEGPFGWEDKATKKVALALHAPGQSSFVTYSCGDGTPTTITGTVLVPVKADTMQTTSVLPFKALEGVQKPEQLEGEEDEVLTASVNGEAFGQLGLTASLKLVNEEAIEINAAV